MKIVLIEERYTKEDGWYGQHFSVCRDEDLDRTLEVFQAYTESSDAYRTRASSHDWDGPVGAPYRMVRDDATEEWSAAFEGGRVHTVPLPKNFPGYIHFQSPMLIPDRTLRHKYHFIVEKNMDGDELRGVGLIPHLPTATQHPEDSDDIWVSGDSFEEGIANAFSILRQK